MTEASMAKQLLAEATHVDVAVVPPDARIGSFERWDSLAHMRLLLAMEQQMGRELDPDEVAQIESLDDIVALLAARGRSRPPLQSRR
jgi:acyl carrier protein